MYSKETLVKPLVDHFIKKGLTIKFAKYVGYENPPSIKRHSPDVIGFDEKESLVYIGIAKNCDDLSEAETVEQFGEFSKRIMKNGKSQKVRVPLCIAIPSECHSKVKQVFENSSLVWKDSIEILQI